MSERRTTRETQGKEDDFFGPPLNCPDNENIDLKVTSVGSRFIDDVESKLSIESVVLLNGSNLEKQVRYKEVGFYACSSFEAIKHPPAFIEKESVVSTSWTYSGGVEKFFTHLCFLMLYLPGEPRNEILMETVRPRSFRFSADVFGWTFRPDKCFYVVTFWSENNDIRFLVEKNPKAPNVSEIFSLRVTIIIEVNCHSQDLCSNYSTERRFMMNGEQRQVFNGNIQGLTPLANYSVGLSEIRALYDAHFECPEREYFPRAKTRIPPTDFCSRTRFKYANYTGNGMSPPFSSENSNGSLPFHGNGYEIN